jgi:hypothetical protein
MADQVVNQEIVQVGLTREGWLEAAIEHFRPAFVEVGYPLPDKMHVSVGFGYGVRAESKFILGQTWKTTVSDDGLNHLFIGPQEGDPAEILVTLLHELIHVALDVEDGHRGRFAEIATRLGFLGPMTQTPPSPTLMAEMLTLAAALGPFPHGKLDVDKLRQPAPVPVNPDGTPGRPVKVHTGPGKQGTRMIKLVAPCGYTVRTTRKWIEEGLPRCPHGDEFEQV